MKQYRGKCICKGIAIGSITFISSQNKISKKVISNIENELLIFQNTVDQVKRDLLTLLDHSKDSIGSEGAEILQSYLILLEDETYLNAISDIITQELVNCAYAIQKASITFSEMLEALPDDAMRTKSMDVQDVSQRLINAVNGNVASVFSLDTPSVIVADTLSTTQLLSMNRDSIQAIVVKKGSPYSHVSILAKLFQIPFMICPDIELKKIKNGLSIIVDALSETVTLSPDDIMLAEAEKQIERQNILVQQLMAYKGLQTLTARGIPVELNANVGSLNDAKTASEYNASGIGLFRTEFLYEGLLTPPSEDALFQTFQDLISLFPKKKVIIRTLDLGADKSSSFISIPKEENPALGYRGIRLAFLYPDLFITQLKAILRASVDGEIAILYPMISCIQEMEQIKRYMKKAIRELEKQNISYRVPLQGIMIETPAAVMMSSELASMVDFFSIGTNDLAQYTYAIDRLNDDPTLFHDQDQLALFRMVEYTVKNAHDAGIPCSVCGEIASDTNFIEKLLAIPVDSLSVSTSQFLEVRKHIRTIK